MQSDQDFGEDLLDSIGPLGADRARPPSRKDSGPGALAQNTTIIRMRSAHHKLAQLCAMGDLTDIEVGALTGYTPTHISNLRGKNPAFRELIAHYAGEARQELLDMKGKQQRLAELALDELTDRVVEAPESFSHRELNELVETNLVKPEAALAKLGQTASGPPSPVTIQFVTAEGSSAKLIEGTPTK